jgi:glucose-specific phosphotransferase system IIA component
MFCRTRRHLDVLAPLSGRVIPIEEVPDPVFSGRMVGDGVAIEPDGDGLVVAPCDGELVVFFSTGHAFGIRSPEGIELLVHIGIETVTLQGEGFTRLASKGDQVKAGQAIVRFDPALIAAKAPSAVTPVVITGGDRLKSFEAATGSVSAGRDVLLRIELD